MTENRTRKLSYEIRFHEPTARHWLYIDAGTDPVDGAPLTWARVASEAEVALWDAGEYEDLEALIRGNAPPARPKPWWRRLLGRLRVRSNSLLD